MPVIITAPSFAADQALESVGNVKKVFNSHKIILVNFTISR